MIIAVGHGISNEELFSSIKTLQKQNNNLVTNKCKVYNVSVGQTITTANYFIRDQKAVEELVFELSQAIPHPHKPCKYLMSSIFMRK